MDMEKTIPPNFDAPKGSSAETVFAPGVSETVGPERALTHREVLSVPNDKRLVPSFFVYEKNKIKHIEIPKDENIFRIGRGESNDIVLNDNTISDTQVAIVKMGDYCYFMDCGTKDCVSFNGVKKRQAVAKVDSRMVMKVGNSLLIYIGIDCRMYDETDSILLKRSLITSHGHRASEAEVLIKCDQGEWYSDSAPILVGSHNTCDYKVTGPQVQPFHFMVYFNKSGLFVEDLTHGTPGIKIDNLRLIGAKPVKEDCSIYIDKKCIFLYVYGDVKERCDALFGDLNEKANLAITNLKNSLEPVCLPKTNERLSIGRSSESNIVIPDPSVSRIHAHVVIRDKCLFLVDNNSHNKTYINLKPITKATVIPGDIIEFGDTPFLLHYQ